MENAKLSVLYAWKIYRKSFCEIWEGFGLWGKIIDGFVIFLSLSAKAFWDRSAEALIGEWDIWAILFVVAILVIPGLAIFNSVKVSALRDKHQQDQMSIKEYDDIGIEKFESPETIDEKRARKTYRNRRVTKLEFLVRNMGNISILSTHVGMADIKWHSEKYNNEPDDIETGFFKWADSNQEKVDIAPKGGYERMLLAIYDIDLPISAFRFVFHGGVSQVPRTLIDGKYSLKIRVDGQAKKEEYVQDLSPVFFAISFDFDYSGFQNVEVSKLLREQTQ